MTQENNPTKSIHDRVKALVDALRQNIESCHPYSIPNETKKILTDAPALLEELKKLTTK